MQTGLQPFFFVVLSSCLSIMDSLLAFDKVCLGFSYRVRFFKLRYLVRSLRLGGIVKLLPFYLLLSILRVNVVNNHRVVESFIKVKVNYLSYPLAHLVILRIDHLLVKVLEVKVLTEFWILFH
jgi:hypothetical protein